MVMHAGGRVSVDCSMAAAQANWQQLRVSTFVGAWQCRSGGHCSAGQGQMRCQPGKASFAVPCIGSLESDDQELRPCKACTALIEAMLT